MRKYLLSSLLIFLISNIYAGSSFADMRVGDFGCVTRVVFEFTENVDFVVKDNVNKLSISFGSQDAAKIKATEYKSENIYELKVTETETSTETLFEFNYPIQVSSYNYKESNNHYMFVFDIFDKQHWIDTDKGLTTLLFKGQKFPLKKISSELTKFLEKHPDNDKVNFYLGMMYGYRKDKVMATNLLNKVPESSKYYASAQDSLTSISRNFFPKTEIKPNYWEIEHDSLNTEQPEVASAATTEPTVNQTDADKPDTEMSSTTSEEPEVIEQKMNLFQRYWLLFFLFFIIIIIIQFVVNYKRKIFSREVNIKLETIRYEKTALENKLKQGIIETSNTKDKIIIKLFNSGWNSKDIANELNAPLEAVEATIKREGRL